MSITKTKLIPLVIRRNIIFLYKLTYLLTSKMVTSYCWHGYKLIIASHKNHSASIIYDKTSIDDMKTHYSVETIRCKYYDIESCNVTATKCTISPSCNLTPFNTVSGWFDPLPCMKSLKKSELVYSVMIVHSEAVVESEFVVGFELQKYAVDYEIMELDVVGSQLHKYPVDDEIKLS